MIKLNIHEEEVVERCVGYALRNLKGFRSTILSFDLDYGAILAIRFAEDNWDDVAETISIDNPIREYSVFKYFSKLYTARVALSDVPHFCSEDADLIYRTLLESSLPFDLIEKVKSIIY